MREEPIIRVFDNMEKLTGNKGSAIPYANEVHLDSKYANTEYGKEIVKHEKRHIERFEEILKGRNKFLVYAKNDFWDFFDVLRIGFKHDTKLFMIKSCELFLFIAIVILALTPIVGHCDSAPPGYYQVDIQGAKVVSEGGYFNFHIKNICEQNITIECLNYPGSVMFISPNDTVTYRMIAPEINSLYENITYTFQVSGYSFSPPNPEKENYYYTVTVVKSDIVTQFRGLQEQLNQTLFFLVITTGICVFIGIRLLIDEVLKFLNFLKRRHKRVVK